MFVIVHDSYLENDEKQNLTDDKIQIFLLWRFKQTYRSVYFAFSFNQFKDWIFFPPEREYFVKLVVQRWSPATCGSCGSGIIRMQRSSCLSCMEDLINSQSVTLHCSVSPASLCRWNLCNGMVQAGGCWEKSRLASATSDMADMKLYSLVNRPSLIIFKSW